MIEKVFNAIADALVSKRFKAFYWSTFTMALAGFLDLVLQELTEWDPDNFLTVLAGLVFAQITKALNNWFNHKPM